MADRVSKRKRSEIMSRVRSKNTKPERLLRGLLSAAFHHLGYRYRLHARGLPGSPDVVFVKWKIAIFLDGAFWHGYKFEEWSHKLDTVYWLPKIKENIRRDARVNRSLRSMGWIVMRVWDHDVKKRPEHIISRIEEAFRIAKARLKSRR